MSSACVWNYAGFMAYIEMIWVTTYWLVYPDFLSWLFAYLQGGTSPKKNYIYYGYIWKKWTFQAWVADIFRLDAMWSTKLKGLFHQTSTLDCNTIEKSNFAMIHLLRNIEHPPGNHDLLDMETDPWLGVLKKIWIWTRDGTTLLKMICCCLMLLAMWGQCEYCVSWPEVQVQNVYPKREMVPWIWVKTSLMTPEGKPPVLFVYNRIKYPHCMPIIGDLLHDFHTCGLKPAKNSRYLHLHNYYFPSTREYSHVFSLFTQWLYHKSHW